MKRAGGAIADWLRSKGFVPGEAYDVTGILEIAWSHRSGYDRAVLRFLPIQRRAGDQGWIATIGCHASGTNPQVELGCCETLEDVQRTCEAVRLINGFPKVQPYPEPREGGAK